MVKELLANSDAEEMKDVAPEALEGNPKNRADLICLIKDHLDNDFRRIESLIEEGLDFCEKYAEA